MKKAKRRKRGADPARRKAARAASGNDDGPRLLPVDELIAHQRALRRLARALQDAGLDEFALLILEELARFRVAVLEGLIGLLGDDEFQTREAAERTLRDLLAKDPSIAAALARAKDATSDAEIEDRLEEILEADPARFQKQIDNLLKEIGPVFFGIQFGPAPQPGDPPLQDIIDELNRDLQEAQEDAKAAKTDSSESGARERAKRFRARERCRQARKPFIDRLRKALFGD